jgi:leader peptidase (prepilin peptidase)/N-methyltransferase
METAFAGISGAVIGSFLNVVVYRLPIGKSLVKPRSHCPSCETPVAPRDNVPLLSWASCSRRA